MQKTALIITITYLPFSLYSAILNIKITYTLRTQTLICCVSYIDSINITNLFQKNGFISNGLKKQNVEVEYINVIDVTNGLEGKETLIQHAQF